MNNINKLKSLTKKFSKTRYDRNTYVRVQSSKAGEMKSYYSDEWDDVVIELGTDELLVPSQWTKSFI